MFKSIAVLGEVMVEMRHAGDGHFRQGFAGDTFNTAVQLSREGLDVRYITSLGRDPFSESVLALAQSEGVNTAAVQRDESLLPGLYLIENDESGERQFHYWRDNSAARHTLANPARCEAITTAINACDAVYLSGITAAVFGLLYEQTFRQLLDAIRTKPLLYDPNYRPRLWPNRSTAFEWNEKLARRSAWVFPTYSDEVALGGSGDEQAILDQYRAWGADEVILKCPEQRARVQASDGQTCTVRSDFKGEVVDTTGAGDAFNAGYIAARTRGDDRASALRHAHQVAGRTVSYCGAIPPND